jgi:endonuclease V-like protein UPF0215 family
VNSDFHIKPEIRILGIDDSALLNEKVMIVGTVFRGGDWIDGVLRSEITRDGLDATGVIVRMIKNSRHYGQLRIIMLDGVTYGGFNVVDIEELYRETGLPVIVVMRSYPDFEKIRSALRHFSDGEERWGIIKKAGEIEKLATERKNSDLYPESRNRSKKCRKDSPPHFNKKQYSRASQSRPSDCNGHNPGGIKRKSIN